MEKKINKDLEAIKNFKRIERIEERKKKRLTLKKELAIKKAERLQREKTKKRVSDVICTKAKRKR